MCYMINKSWDVRCIVKLYSIIDDRDKISVIKNGQTKDNVSSVMIDHS